MFSAVIHSDRVTRITEVADGKVIAGVHPLHQQSANIACQSSRHERRPPSTKRCLSDLKRTGQYSLPSEHNVPRSADTHILVPAPHAGDSSKTAFQHTRNVEKKLLVQDNYDDAAGSRRNQNQFSGNLRCPVFQDAYTVHAHWMMIQCSAHCSLTKSAPKRCCYVQICRCRKLIVHAYACQEKGLLFSVEKGLPESAMEDPAEGSLPGLGEAPLGVNDVDLFGSRLLPDFFREREGNVCNLKLSASISDCDVDTISPSVFSYADAKEKFFMFWLLSQESKLKSPTTTPMKGTASTFLFDTCGKSVKIFDTPFACVTARKEPPRPWLRELSR